MIFNAQGRFGQVIVKPHKKSTVYHQGQIRWLKRECSGGFLRKQSHCIAFIPQLFDCECKRFLEASLVREGDTWSAITSIQRRAQFSENVGH
jgi:hypothetical protein